MRKIVKSKKSRLYINYDTSTTGGEALSDDAFPDRADAFRTLDIKGIHRTQGKFFMDSLEVDPEVFQTEEVYLVTVRYTDGDTFGRCHGYHRFWSIRKTLQEAEADKKYIEGTVGKGHRNKQTGEFYDWNAYFADLDTVEIEKFRVQE